MQKSFRAVVWRRVFASNMECALELACVPLRCSSGLEVGGIVFNEFLHLCLYLSLSLSLSPPPFQITCPAGMLFIEFILMLELAASWPV